MRLLLLGIAVAACGTPPQPGGEGGGAISTAGGSEAGGSNAGGGTAGGAEAGGSTAGGSTAGGASAGGSTAGGAEPLDAGFPNVDRSNPQLYQLSFTAKQADDAGSQYLGSQRAYLDTRVAPRGQLVVYLHGATSGAPATCGSVEHGRMLASWGFHFFAPCYASDYGVGNCGADIGGCRLEAFDGMPRNAALDISRPNSIEERIIKGLQYLQTVNPKGDWSWYLENGQPRWSSIIITGISHGASSAGLIGKVRPVARSVMLSGPLDTNQAWLAMNSVTAPPAFWGFTHTADTQHPGHLAAFQTMMLPGAPMRIEDAGVPYGGSHRLFTSVPATDGHSSTEAGGVSPKTADGGYVFWPVWRQMYTGAP